MLYRLVKPTRRIRILLGGYKEMEREHFLFDLSRPLGDKEVRKRLIPLGFQYNFLSTTHKRQRWTSRKLVGQSHQIHLRFYGPGADSIEKVSGHYELDPMIWPQEHLRADDLRSPNEEEKQETNSALTQP